MAGGREKNMARLTIEHEHAVRTRLARDRQFGRFLHELGAAAQPGDREVFKRVLEDFAVFCYCMGAEQAGFATGGKIGPHGARRSRQV